MAAPANGSLVLLTRRNHGREANTRGEKILKNLHPRSSEARRESFALLTKTYHGSRVIGNLKSSFLVSALISLLVLPFISLQIQCGIFRFRLAER